MIFSEKKLYPCVFFVGAFVLFAGCKTSEEFTGFNYDPPDVTNTTTKNIKIQSKRIIGAGQPRVWISNEFEGARFNDFQKTGEHHYTITIEPELAPVNNSPWYAFKLWSDSSQSVTFTLRYRDGEHRYYPDISTNGMTWTPIDSTSFSADTASGTATFTLNVSETPLWVSAQELNTSVHFNNWITQLGSRTYVRVQTVGRTHLNKPVKELLITEVPPQQPARVLIVLGRQHPPEIPGYLTTLHFLQEIAGDSDLARRFRQHFVVLAYPFINPDGADNGHWRYNTGGVDLNRDWVHFNQPETKAVRDAILDYHSDSLRSPVYGIDFHSTDENIFYPILPEIKKTGGDITFEWVAEIQAQFPDIVFNVEPFDTSSPIAKNWFFHTFGIDALTYEVNDDMDRAKLEPVARYAAQSLMQQFLKNL